VLDEAAVPLGELRRHVLAWIEAREKKQTAHRSVNNERLLARLRC